MQTILLSPDTPLPRPCVATIGFFDGVHKGHRHLIRHVIDTAREARMESAVITFSRHPRQVLHSSFQPRMLSTADEKAALLAQTGIDNCVILPFDERTAALSAHDFMSGVLRDRLNVRTLITGYDNRFGHNRSEGFDDYVRYGRSLGIDVRRGQPFALGGVRVSSSVIRAFLQEGEAVMAARCLGYPYTIIGTVMHGEHIGSSMGFPTANLQPDDSLKLIPAGGVYATEVRLPDDSRAWPAMTNIGSRPTFGGTRTTIETHILGFRGDLYGRRMSVSFISRLRDEQRFRTPAELAAQLRRDLRATEELFARENPDSLS